MGARLSPYSPVMEGSSSARSSSWGWGLGRRAKRENSPTMFLSRSTSSRMVPVDSAKISSSSGCFLL